MAYKGKVEKFVDVEPKRGMSLTKRGFIAYGYICSGEVEISKDQLKDLVDLDPSERHEALAKMNEENENVST